MYFIFNYHKVNKYASILKSDAERLKRQILQHIECLIWIYLSKSYLSLSKMIKPSFLLVTKQTMEKHLKSKQTKGVM